MRTSTVLNSNSNSRSSDTQQEFGKRGVVKRSFSRTTRGVELVWSGTRRRWPAVEAHLVMETMWCRGRWDGRFSFTRSGTGCESQTGWAWDQKGPWSPSDGCVPFHTQQLTCPGSHGKEGTNWGPRPVSCPPVCFFPWPPTAVNPGWSQALPLSGQCLRIPGAVGTAGTSDDQRMSVRSMLGIQLTFNSLLNFFLYLPKESFDHSSLPCFTLEIILLLSSRIPTCGNHLTIDSPVILWSQGAGRGRAAEHRQSWRIDAAVSPLLPWLGAGSIHCLFFFF